MSNVKKALQHLVVSVLGSDHPGIANELCKLASHSGCNIIDSRVTTLGMEFIASLLLTGSWNAIAKFEASLPAFEQKHDLRIISRRTQPRAPQPDYFPYSVYVVALEQADVVYKITQFFADQSVNIHDLYVGTYIAPFSGSPMLSVALSITVPKIKLVADLRESFMLFCDDHNFDAVIEPQKN